MATPVEFGATGLSPADPIKHPMKGAVGALIIEPEGSVWEDDYEVPKSGNRKTRTAADIKQSDGTLLFREFVLVFQDSINLYGSDPAEMPVGPSLVEQDDVEDSGKDALNYRTEPFWFRMGYPPGAPGTFTRERTDWDTIFTESPGGSLVGPPKTPVFKVSANMPTRLRVLHPAGQNRNHVFSLHGHTWQQLPYMADSTEIGDNPLSEWKGSQAGIGPSEHRDFVLQNGAGGQKNVLGDYLFRDGEPGSLDGGIWGIMRVTK